MVENVASQEVGHPPIVWFFDFLLRYRPLPLRQAASSLPAAVLGRRGERLGDSHHKRYWNSLTLIISKYDLSIQEKSSSGELPNAVHRQ